MVEVSEQESTEQEEQLREVFVQLQGAIRDAGGQVELIEIRRANGLEYPCRVTFTGAEDSQGVFVSL